MIKIKEKRMTRTRKYTKPAVPGFLDVESAVRQIGLQKHYILKGIAIQKIETHPTIKSRKNGLPYVSLESVVTYKKEVDQALAVLGRK